MAEKDSLETWELVEALRRIEEWVGAVRKVLDSSIETMPATVFVPATTKGGPIKAGECPPPKKPRPKKKPGNGRGGTVKTAPAARTAVKASPGSAAKKPGGAAAGRRGKA
jgi:hypothetical protein